MLFLLLLCCLCSCLLASTLSDFKRNNGLVVLPNLLSKSQFASVQKEVAVLGPLLKKEVNSIAEGRLGCRIAESNVIIDIFSDPKVKSRIAKVTGRPIEGLKIPTLFPLEVRNYQKGSCMPFHKDEQLYAEAQLEFVFTVKNTSDSFTCYVDLDGNTQKLRTEENSLVIIEANSCLHSVTQLRKGKRVIIKGLMCTSEEVLCEKSFNEALGTYGAKGKAKK